MKETAQNELLEEWTDVDSLSGELEPSTLPDPPAVCEVDVLESGKQPVELSVFPSTGIIVVVCV